ncbi:hypothetical protein B0H17DRAFT_1324286 [Mycena rosella]|uniref:Uncharacterized protein n=1 Tax=Mycena rosella TaxID=1033263 RepID=A0AAD7MCG1_MYCRO|nr:hypothetical protein B0H17DRAFT_1324286 [Mycena rosella]
MPHREKENKYPSRLQTARHRRPTSRLKDTRDATSAAAEMKRKKKAKKVKRLALKQRQNESALTADRPDDTPEIQELRAALSRAQGERNAAEAANSRPEPQGPPSRSIARPRNMAKVMAEGTWSFSITTQMLMAPKAKEQDNRRLAKVYDAIEAAYPDLERFRAQWATAFLVHESSSVEYQPLPIPVSIPWKWVWPTSSVLLPERLAVACPYCRPFEVGESWCWKCRGLAATIIDT